MSTVVVAVEAEAEKAAAVGERENPPAIASPVTTSRAGHTYVDPKDSPRKIKRDKNAIYLDKADALFWRGVSAIKSDQFEEALNSLSKALDMRVEYYGERSPECASAYCEYGRALFYKAIDKYVTTSSDDDDENQIVEEEESEEEDDCAEEKKEEDAASEISDYLNKRRRADDIVGVEICRDEMGGSSAAFDMESQEPSSKNAGEEQSKVEEDDFLEDAPNLDLAWKMLDIGREILEKDKRADVLKMADVVSTLGDISLEMEDFDSSLADYFKALSILEGIMDPDSPQIASLCYKICLALDCMDMLTEALNFGRRAVKVLEFHLNRIESEVKRLDRAACLNRIKTEMKHIDEAASPLKDDKILPVPTSIEKCLMKRKRSHLHDMRLYSRILIDFKEKVEELEKFMEKDEGPEEREEAFTKGNVPSTKKIILTPKNGITHVDVGGRGNGIKKVMQNSVFGEAARGVKRRCREEEHFAICAKKQCCSKVAYLKAKSDAANKRIKAQSLQIL